ncbi:MAG: hypothetical protein V4492_06105 [Chlamydiota bacterium]
MNTTATLIWHAFLQSAPASMRDALNRSVTTELLKEIESSASAPESLLKEGKGEDEVLRVHYSWFAPFLRSQRESDIKLFLGCLAPEQVKGLKAMLLLSNSVPTPASTAMEFLRKSLWEALTSEEIIPVSYLPASPLNALLDLSYNGLNSLIELLSMHDLSVEIRHIIETSKIKKIYSVLTKAQATFLKTLLHKKEAVTFKKMGLINWKMDTDSLRHMLTQRGLNRIAKALHRCPPSLLWHAAHRLDAEKGAMLMNLCTPLDHPRAAALLTDQVSELALAIKTHNPTLNP